MKRTVCLVVLLLIIMNFIIFIGCSSEENIPIPTVETGKFVYDDANILDKDISHQVNEMLAELEEKTTVEFAVITVDSLLNNSIESYSIYLANELHIGKKEKDNGILLLIVKSDSKVRLEIGKGLEGLLNDGKCGRILYEFFVPYRNEDDLSHATLYTVQAIINIVAEDAGVSIENVDRSITVSEPNNTIKLIVLIIIIILAIVVGILKTKYGSDSDSYHGGFWGSGSSSGGSFGGGSFGGGGASR